MTVDADFSKMSDEELEAIASGQPSGDDLSILSDAQLEAIAAGGQPDIAESPLDVVTQGLSGFNESLANIMRVLEAPVSLIGLETREKLISDTMEQLKRFGQTGEFERPRIPTPVSDFVREQTTVAPPTSPAGRTARTTGQVLGMEIPLIATGIGGAPAFTRMLANTRPAFQEAASGILERAGRFGRSLVEETARGTAARPATALAGETAAATGAGTGVGIARENELPLGAEVAASFVGAMTPAVATQAILNTPINFTIRRTKAALGKAEEASQEAARAFIADSFKKADPQTVEEGEALQGIISQLAREVDPEVGSSMRLTLAELLEDRNLLSDQLTLGKKLVDQSFDNEITRRRNNDRLIRAASRAIVGENDVAPNQVIVEAKAGARDAIERVEAQFNNLNREAERNARRLAAGKPITQDETGRLRGKGAQARARGVERTLDRTRRGEIIREKIITLREAEMARMRQIADEAGLNDNNNLFDFGQIRSGMLEELRKSIPIRLRGNVKESKVLQNQFSRTSTFQMLRDMADRQSVNNVMNLNSSVGADLADAIRSGARPEVIRGLSAAKKRIDDFINEGIDQVVAQPGIARRFIDEYKENIINRFNTGATFKVTRRGDQGFRTLPEQVAESFFKPRQPSLMREYSGLFSKDIEAIDAMTNEIIDSFMRSALKNNQIDLRAAQNWVQRHEDVLDHAPFARNLLRDEVTRTRAIVDRKAQLTNRQSAVEKNVLAKELDNLGTTVPEMEEFILKNLDRPAKLTNLLRTIQSQEARNGLARVVWNITMRQNDPSDFFKRHDAGISRVMRAARIPDSRIQMARAIAEGARRTRLIEPPAGAGFQLVNGLAKIEGLLNTAIPQLSSRIFAVQSGRTSPRFIGTELAARIFSGFSSRRAAQVVEESIFDADLARAMSDFITKPEPPQVRRLGAALLASGLVPDEGEE